MANISNVNVRINFLDSELNPALGLDEWYLMPEFKKFKELFVKASYSDGGWLSEDSNTGYVFGRWAFHANWKFKETAHYLKELHELKNDLDYNLKYIQLEYSDLDHSDFYEFGCVNFDVDLWDDTFIGDFEAINFSISSLVEKFNWLSFKSYLINMEEELSPLGLNEVLKRFKDDHVFDYDNYDALSRGVDDLTCEYHSYIEEQVDNLFFESDIKQIIADHKNPLINQVNLEL